MQNIVARTNRTAGFLRRNLKECKPPVKGIAYNTRSTTSPGWYASTVFDDLSLLAGVGLFTYQH